MSMRKNILKTLLITSVISTSLLVGCGEKDNNEATTPTTSEVESTIVEDATTSEPIVEETTSEEVTNEVEEPTSPSEEVTTEAPTTEEPTTIVEETTTSKVEETTKAPEPTTQAPTQAPTEAPTPAPSGNSASIEKLKSLHVAYRPKESYVEIDYDLTNQLGGFAGVKGPDYREMADYVDSDYGDGTKKNPYVMYEWTTRKYWGDRDEVTAGYYCYKEDLDRYNNPPYDGICMDKAKEIQKVYDYSYDGTSIKIGTYEGRDIYFNYYFLIDVEYGI